MDLCKPGVNSINEGNTNIPKNQCIREKVNKNLSNEIRLVGSLLCLRDSTGSVIVTVDDYVQDCRKDAEEAVRQCDYGLCSEILSQALSFIRQFPSFSKEYLYLLESDGVFAGALAYQNGKGKDCLKEFLNDYLLVDSLVCETKYKEGLLSISRDEWKFNTYSNVAYFCECAKIGHESLYYYQEAINIQRFSLSPDYGQIEKIYSYMYSVAKWLVEDHPLSVKYIIASAKASLENNGYQSSEFYQSYYSAYVAYNIPIATSTSFEINKLQDEQHPHLDFSQNLEIIHLWREFELELSTKYGNEYLKDLHAYCNTIANNYAQEHRGISYENTLEQLLPPVAFSYLTEVKLNIFFNDIEGYHLSENQLFHELFKSDWELCDELTYRVIDEISEFLIRQGYMNHAVELLCFYYSALIEEGGLKEREMAEKVCTEIGMKAWNAGDDETLLTATRPAKLLSERLLGFDYYHVFFDINELLKQLVLAVRSYRDIPEFEGKVKEYQDIAERLIDNDVVCLNGESASNDTKAFVYGEIAHSCDDAIIAERYYEKQARYDLDSLWFISNRLNRAYLYSQNGQNLKSESFILEVENFLSSKSISLDGKWEIFRLKCKINNALANKDSVMVKSLAIQCFDYIKNEFLSISQRSSISSVFNCWESEYQSTLRDFTTFDRACDNNDARVSYDAALWQKGILARAQSIVANNVESSKDQYLKQAHQAFVDAHRNNSDSLSTYEKDFLNRYASHPEFLDNPAVPSWNEVKQSLKQNEVAIEFSSIYDKTSRKLLYVAIILDKKHEFPILYQLCERDELETIISGTTNNNGYPMAYDDFSDGLNAIYKLVWSPIEDVIKDATTVYFAPYGFLYNINIECLRKTEDSQPMCDLFNIIRLSSTGEIIGHQDKQIRTAAVFGDMDYNYTSSDSQRVDEKSICTNLDEPIASASNRYADLRGFKGEWDAIPFATDEVSYVTAVLEENNVSTTLYSQDKATEEAFKRLPPECADIIHLSTHGYYFNYGESAECDYFTSRYMKGSMTVGQRSGLIFSGANLAWKGMLSRCKVEDGVLTADEILGLDLSSTDLLVLSACQTALGEIGSDDVYGISRSFKIAGVNTIVMSLWKVDDEATKLLMTSFYENLMHGKSKRAAFNDAVKSVRSFYESRARESSSVRPKYKRYDSAYYWSSFIMLD